MSRSCAALVAIPLALVAASAAAEPPAPAGWSREHRGEVAVYVPRGAKGVELRLHPDATSRHSLEDWFSGRLSTAPADVDLAGYAASQDLKDGAVRMAFGMGTMRGAQVVVLALACQKSDASKVYGELISPQDEEALKRYTKAATEIVVKGCSFDGARQAPSTRDSEPPAPKKAGSPEFRYIARNKRGLSRSQIEVVLYSWEHIVTPSSMSVEEDAYLLLKNGRARKVPPVPPEDFDAAAEMAAEPQQWGTWKKKGGEYLIKLAGDKDFVTPPGQRIGRPAPANHRLKGEYFTSSEASFGPEPVLTSWEISYLAFDRDRFSQRKNGGSGGTLGDTTTVTRWDDEGSASSVTNPNLGAGRVRRGASNAADRQGTYRIDGYTMELHYDSGRVDRRFFFMTSEKSIWFGDVAFARKSKD